MKFSDMLEEMKLVSPGSSDRGRPWSQRWYCCCLCRVGCQRSAAGPGRLSGRPPPAAACPGVPAAGTADLRQC